MEATLMDAALVEAALLEVADGAEEEALGVTPAAAHACVPSCAATVSRITHQLNCLREGGRCNLRAASVALQELPTQAVYDEMKGGERQRQVVFETTQPLPLMEFRAQFACIQSH